MFFLDRLQGGGLGRLLFSSAMIQVSGVAAATLVGIQLARYLGPASYGIYGLTMTATAVLAVFAQFGLPLLATREAASAVSSRPQASLRSVIPWFLKVSVGLAIGVSAVCSISLLVWSPGWLEGRRNLITYAAISLILLTIVPVVSALLRGAGRNLAGQAADAVLRPVVVALVLFLIAGREGEVSVPDALAAGIFASLVALAYTCGILIRLYRFDGRIRLPYAPARWLKTSASFTSTSVLFALNGNFPILVAGLFVSVEELGVFRVAMSSLLLVSVPLTIANIAVPPIIARLHSSGDEPAVSQVLSQTTIFSFLTTAALLAAIAALGREFLSFVFGEEYIGAHVPLLILGSSFLLMSWFGIAGSYLNMTGREGLVIRAFLIAVPVGVLLSLPLTWAFGINGAALGNLCTVITWHLVVIFVHRRQVGIGLSAFSAWKNLRR